MNTAERIPQLARDERLARWVGLAWGFAEGLLFFIVPDVYVTFAALYSLRAGAIAWLASIAGSLVAVTVIHVLMATGVDYVGWLPHVPAISVAMLERVRAGIAAGGLPYTPLLIAGGVPLKVYAGQAFALGTPLVAVLAWTAFARLVRIAPVFAAAAVTNRLFRGSIERAPVRWCGLLLTGWFLFYVWYFIRMGS